MSSKWYDGALKQSIEIFNDSNHQLFWHKVMKMCLPVIRSKLMLFQCCQAYANKKGLNVLRQGLHWQHHGLMVYQGLHGLRQGFQWPVRVLMVGFRLSTRTMLLAALIIIILLQINIFWVDLCYWFVKYFNRIKKLYKINLWNNKREWIAVHCSLPTSFPLLLCFPYFPDGLTGDDAIKTPQNWQGRSVSGKICVNVSSQVNEIYNIGLLVVF